MKAIAIFSINSAAMILVIISAAATVPFYSLKTGQTERAGDSERNSDKSSAPYFLIGSDDPTDRLPLKSTHAEVNIAGVIADVRITQEYANEGHSTIEAVYIFPASTRAAVYALKMRIGERTITARIKDRDDARSEYESAKNNGQTASLLEEERPNVFRMSVANILPGDKIQVELQYTELLIPEAGTYSFIYPTVTGPRYQGQSAENSQRRENWVTNPYLREGVLPTSSFSFHGKIDAGMPLKQLRCTTHKTDIKYLDAGKAEISLDPSEQFHANKDLVIEYRLAGEKISQGLLLYEGEDENFFMAMIQPPARVSPEDIPPREYIFIMDVSGSMHGFPLETSKQLMHNLLTGLRTEDRFNVLLFAGASSLFSLNSVAANKENVSRALQFIDKENGGGGTELLPALHKALSLNMTEDAARSFIIATDGYVTVEKEAFNLIRKSRDKANFFAFGIGTAVNRYLIEGMAIAGGGVPFIVTNQNTAPDQASQFRKYVNSPVLSHIRIKFKDVDAYDIEPQSVADLFDERPVIITGKYHGNVQGSVIVTGLSANGEFKTEVRLNSVKPSRDNAALRYLWAREKIRNLDDYGTGDGNRAEVKRLGMQYNLLTRFTSFVAIDSETRNSGAQPITVNQPLPLPEGVTEYATGNITCAGLGISRKDVRNIEGIQVSEMMIEEENKELPEVSSTQVDVMPEFPSGNDAMKRFILQNRRFPEEAKRTGVRGTVYVSFIVNTDGSLSDVRILRGIGSGCDEEAVRVIEAMPRWIPGTRNGVKVNVKMIIPVDFN